MKKTCVIILSPLLSTQNPGSLVEILESQLTTQFSAHKDYRADIWEFLTRILNLRTQGQPLWLCAVVNLKANWLLRIVTKHPQFVDTQRVGKLWMLGKNSQKSARKVQNN